MRTPSPAERLDRAIDRVVDGDDPVVDGDLRPLLRTATLVRAALPPIPAADGFSQRLAAQLVEPNLVLRLAGRAGDAARRNLADRRRLIAAGAVSSAAVGVTVTAVAVWLTARRQSAHRPLHR
ncbi:MAG TPA: hypothetical protein VF013_06005 [Candidatus Limnocylindria bacterium]